MKSVARSCRGSNPPTQPHVRHRADTAGNPAPAAREKEITMDNVHNPDKQVFSPAEAGEWLGLTSVGATDPDASMRHLHKSGKLRGAKIGGYLVFLRADLTEYTNVMHCESLVKEANREPNP